MLCLTHSKRAFNKHCNKSFSTHTHIYTHKHTEIHITRTYTCLHAHARTDMCIYNVTHATINNTKITKITKTKSDHFN